MYRKVGKQGHSLLGFEEGISLSCLYVHKLFFGICLGIALAITFSVALAITLCRSTAFLHFDNLALFERRFLSGGWNVLANFFYFVGPSAAGHGQAAQKSTYN